MKQKILKSIPKNSSRYFKILLGILLLVFSMYFLSISIVTKEKDYFYFIISCLLFSVGFTCFCFTIPFDTIDIYNDSIEITSFWGTKKIIIRNEIIQLNSSYPSTVAWKAEVGTLVLKIRTKDTVYRINESYYKNYFALHNELTKSKIQLTTEYDYSGSSRSKQDTFIIIVSLLFFLSIIIFQQLSK
jgi:hypothetical protein